MQHAKTQPIRELEARGYTGQVRNALRPDLNNNGTPLLQHIRGARVLARFVLAFTLLSFMTVDVTWARTQGEMAAAQIPVVAKAPPPEPANLSEALQAMKEAVHERKAAVAQSVRDRSGVVDQVLNAFGASRLGTENMDELTKRAGQINTWHQRQRDAFAKTEQYLREKKVPEKILQRHREAVAAYEAGYQKMQANLSRVNKANSLLDQNEALEALQQQLDGEQFEKSQEPFDPHAPLPFGPAEQADKREPNLTLDPVTARMTPAERGEAVISKALATVGAALIAPAHAAFAPPGSADLAPTTEVVINDAIRAKAAELHNSPVEIYNWVRNTVEWVPTYGAIQTSDMTLATLRGNSFDTASLLIALLRAANVPARYAYGVIEVPADKIQNWVGGVDNPSAAQQVLGQGGIPNAGLTAGGRVVSIRMEHTWVEAFVDYQPSRGAKHVTGDSWVPMDASYKQYDYTTGYDLATNVPFDAQGLINDLQATATTNETEGWVQNVDQAVIAQRFEQYKTQVENYINTANPDATVGEVLGTRNTIVFEPQTLAAGLPYRLEAITARYSEIPNPLRHTYTVSLAENTPLAIATEAKIFNVTLPLSVVTSKALALSFVPATPADEDLLLSYLQPAADGSLPTALPGYLIYMKAQLTLDGEIIAQGGSFAMGTELSLSHRFYDPRRTVRPVSSNIIVGEYHAIGVDGGSINPNLLTQTKTQLEQAKTELEAIRQQLDANQTPVISDFLTKHTLTGNLLQTGILGYFAINDALDQLDAKSIGVVTHRLPSIGTFSTSLQPQYLYGSIPQNVKLAGLSMDVDRISTLSAAKDDNAQKDIAFFRTTGPRKSAFEHLVPEQLFSTPTQPAQAISAVKALAIAASQGQKIYTLTKTNAAQLNNLTISQAAKNEIAAALNANKEVTVHQAPITYAGWIGEGYIIIDPETGAGAYKIAGGANGGKMISDATLSGLSAATLVSSGPNRRFSDILMEKIRLNTAIHRLARVSLFYDAVMMLFDEKLTMSAKIGRMMTLVASSLGVIGIAAIFAAPNFILGAIIVAVLTLVLSVVADLINDAYFPRKVAILNRRGLVSWA